MTEREDTVKAQSGAPVELGNFTAPTAVTYQRVSTKEQAAKGGRDEGFSIPAQREANARKAESLGAHGPPPLLGPLSMRVDFF